MAASAVSITTAGTTLNKVWRKVQGPLLQGFQTKCEEWALLKSLKNFEIDVSAREITSPVDINNAYGAALINEGDYEANPVTPNVDEVTLTWSNYNQRWTTTLTTKYLDARGGLQAQVVRQFKYQAMKAIESLSNTVGRDFYGYSTGYYATTTTIATQASGTYTLATAYNDSTLTNAAFIASFFQVGDRVALVRTGALVANAIGVITAKTPATPSIAVTWNGSVTSASGDQVVLANSIGNTVLGDTHYNKALTGLLDGSISASVHSLTNANWVAGYSDTAGGRWSGVKLRKALQGIQNKGGGTGDTVVWSQGVSNDVFAAQAGALRFSDPMAMELNGNATAKGIKFFSSRKTPNGYTWVMDATNSVKKFTLLDFPDTGSVGWEDGDKVQDKNAYAFSIDFPMALVWTNRGNIAYFSGLTEQ